MIGDILNKVKVSRRTLHYYDQIDLLKPTVSKENGYRYYDDKALLKLQTILSLKSMDYSLEQIKDFFDTKVPSNIAQEDPWIPLLQEQINYAALKIENLRRKQFILRSVLHTIGLSGKRNEEHVLQLIERMESQDFQDGEIPASFPSKYFNEGEMEVLKQLPLLGSEDSRIEQALMLLKKTRAIMSSAFDESAEREIVERWRDCIAGWFKGDIELQEKYFAFIDSTNMQKPAIWGLDEKLIRYIDSLIEKYLNEGGGNE